MWEPGSDDGDGDDHDDGSDHAFKHYFSLEPTQFGCLLRDPIREGLESRATALLVCEFLEHAQSTSKPLMMLFIMAAPDEATITSAATCGSSSRLIGNGMPDDSFE